MGYQYVPCHERQWHSTPKDCVGCAQLGIPNRVQHGELCASRRPRLRLPGFWPAARLNSAGCLPHHNSRLARVGGRRQTELDYPGGGIRTRHRPMVCTGTASRNAVHLHPTHVAGAPAVWGGRPVPAGAGRDVWPLPLRCPFSCYWPSNRTGAKYPWLVQCRPACASGFIPCSTSAGAESVTPPCNSVCVYVFGICTAAQNTAAGKAVVTFRTFSGAVH